jgi:integrase
MGTRYRRKSDGRWVAAISIGPRGRRTTLTRYAKTRREADLLLDELRRLARPAPLSGRMTVGRFLRSWLDGDGRRSLKPGTWRTYDVALRLHIEPAIGGVTLHRLTADHVDAMLMGLELESKGQRNVLGVLSRILDVAIARGLVLRNAARLVSAPRVVVAETPLLEPDQVAPFLDAIRGDRLEALWLMAFGTGMRQAELLGLRWQDVDLDTGQATVRYALSRVDGHYVLDEPKTKRSKRPMHLPSVVVDALRDHQARQKAERIAAGVPTIAGLVFVSPVGRPLNGGWVSHRWRAIAQGAGLSVTFHGLRHTHSTILSDRGIAEDVRMRRLGHATTDMARRYAHATDAPDVAAAEVMDAVLRGR